MTTEHTEKLARVVTREDEARATLSRRKISTQDRLQAENVLAECAMQRQNLDAAFSAHAEHEGADHD